MTPFCLSSSLHLLLSPSAHHWFFLPFLASSSSPDSWCEWRRTKKRTRKRTTTSSPQLLFILLQSEVSVCWCKQIRDSHRVFLNTKTYLADVKSRVMNHTATLNFSTHTSTTSFHVVFLCSHATDRHLHPHLLYTQTFFLLHILFTATSQLIKSNKKKPLKASSNHVLYKHTHREEHHPCHENSFFRNERSFV